MLIDAPGRRPRSARTASAASCCPGRGPLKVVSARFYRQVYRWIGLNSATIGQDTKSGLQATNLMCGIAGYFSTGAREDLTLALHRMTEAIVHRGPDDVGYFESATRDGRA